MKTMRTLMAVVAILVLSTAVFAAPKDNHAKNPNNPNAPTTDGAIWGPSSSVTTIQHGNSDHTSPNNASDQGVYHQSLVDYLKAMAKGLGLVVDGAIWG